MLRAGTKRFDVGEGQRMFKIPPLWPFFYEFSESLPWSSLSFSEIRKTSREALQSALTEERCPLRLFAEGKS